MITSLDIETISFLLNYAKVHKITNKFTLASCLVYNNKKYGTSTNNYNKSNLLTRNYKLTSCAEANTLLKASRLLNVSKFRNSTLVITGLGKSNKCNILKSTYPCKYCYDLISNFNVKRLVYVTSKDNKQLTINEEILNGRKL